MPCMHYSIFCAVIISRGKQKELKGVVHRLSTTMINNGNADYIAGLIVKPYV